MRRCGSVFIEIEIENCNLNLENQNNCVRVVSLCHPAAPHPRNNLGYSGLQTPNSDAQYTYRIIYRLYGYTVIPTTEPLKSDKNQLEVVITEGNRGRYKSNSQIRTELLGLVVC